MHASDHFRDGRFFNPGVNVRGFRDLIRWMLHRNRGTWSRAVSFVESTRTNPPVERLLSGDLRVTFINHATVLLQVGPVNVLTDPMWSMRASPVSWLGPKRHRPPGVSLDQLPPIDIILQSHDHYDHFDVPTLRRIASQHNPTVFCPLRLKARLQRIGFNMVHELDWWEKAEYGDVVIHCVPAQHFSGRTPFDRNRTLWCGWAMETPAGVVYFAGDTGFGGHFDAIVQHFSPPRLSLFPIGAYRPEWFMGPIHMSPAEALRAHRLMHSGTSVALHFGTFPLADDGETEAPDYLRNLLKGTPDEDNFWILQEGEARDVPPARIVRDTDERRASY